MKSLQSSIAVCLIFGWQTVLGLEVLEVTVNLEDGRYHVIGRSLIEAPPEFIYETLMDYENFYKLANGIAETRLLPNDESGDMMAYTRFESCVLFFCKSVEKVERIKGDRPNTIYTEAIADLSDFSFNESNWRIEQVEDATLLTFETEFDPDFWVPPLIGTWAIRRKLVNTAELIGTRIEWMQARGLTLAQVSESTEPD